MKHSLSRLCSLLAIAALVACGGAETEETTVSDSLTEVNPETAASGDVVRIDDAVFGIPSPIESAMFIKEQGAGFRTELLSDPESLEYYQKNSEKALALGMYGAQLGYICLFDQNEMALTHLNATRKLSDDLGISGAFSETLIERFSENLGNEDSLLVLVSDIYKAGDAYLKTNERNDIAALVIAGGWIESLYMSCVESENGNKDITQRIAEQKSGLAHLLKLLEQYEENSTAVDITAMLEKLQKEYDPVTSSYSYVRPVTDKASQTTTIKGKHSYNISEADLARIVSTAVRVRTSLNR